MKLFIYNFGGTIYETYTAFDKTYYAMMKECRANNLPVSRQVVDGDKVTDEYEHNGIWF